MSPQDEPKTARAAAQVLADSYNRILRQCDALYLGRIYGKHRVIASDGSWSVEEDTLLGAILGALERTAEQRRASGEREV